MIIIVSVFDDAFAEFHLEVKQLVYHMKSNKKVKTN
jgi:hypothetical protein